MDLARAQALIIDDNPQVRSLLAAALKGVTAGVHEASDAISGLQVWLDQRPELVFVDFEMPEVNGAAFIKILRGQEAVLGVRCAVLMVTGHSDRDHVLAAREAGADGFIVKPLSVESILARAAEALAALPAAKIAYV